MKKNLFVLIGMGLFAASASAADMAGSASIGTTGFGVHLSIPATQNLNARFGINAFNYSYDDSTTDANYNFKLKLMTFDALADWFPIEDSGFRVTGGLIYNGNKITGTATPTAAGTYTFQGNTYTAATVGSINAKLDFKKITPYLGVGWGTNLSSGQAGWSFFGDLGAMFQGNPKTSLTSNNCTAGAAVCNQLAADLAAENADVRNDVDSFKVYPVIRFGATYRF